MSKTEAGATDGEDAVRSDCLKTLPPALTGESERFNPIDNRGAYRPSGGSSLENMEIRRIDPIALATLLDRRQPMVVVQQLWAIFGGIFTHFPFAVADGFIERNRAAHQAGSVRSAENQRAHLHQALRAGRTCMDGTHHLVAQRFQSGGGSQFRAARRAAPSRRPRRRQTGERLRPLARAGRPAQKPSRARPSRSL